MKISKVENIILILLYTLFFHASACANMVIDDKDYTLYRNYAIIFIIIFLLIKYRKLTKLFSNVYCNIWYVFAFFVMIASFPLYITEGVKLLLVPVVYFMIMQYDIDLLIHIAWASILDGIWILIQSIQYKGIRLDGYFSGIFRNPNTFGASMAVFFIGVCCLFLYAKYIYQKVILILLGIIAFSYQLLSFCRSALITSVIILLLVLFFHERENKNRRRVYIYSLITIFSAFLLLIWKGAAIVEIISLHVFKWDTTSGDLSSSRTEMWKEVILHPTLFGSTPKFHPHNTFLAVSYYYGIVAGLILTGLVISILYKIFVQYWRSKDVRQYTAIIYIITFICIGMFEESLGFTGREWMIIGFCGLGYASKELVRNHKKDRKG